MLRHVLTLRVPVVKIAFINMPRNKPVHIAHRGHRVMRFLGDSIQFRTSVAEPDFNLAVDRRYTVGVARNGHGLVCRFLRPSAASQPYDAIRVGIDMNPL
jgi:hypothetical protein